MPSTSLVRWWPGIATVLLLLGWCAQVRAIPTYSVETAECVSDRGPTNAKAFAITPFLQSHRPDGLWILTALHAVNGCKRLTFKRLGANSPIPGQPDRALIWRDRDLVAFPIARELAGLTESEQPGQVIPPPDLNPLEGRELEIWTMGITPGERRFVRSQSSAFVGELRRQLAVNGFAGDLGSISDSAMFLEYSSDVGPGDSGAAVTLTSEPNSVVGIHMAGAAPSGRALICWALIFSPADIRTEPASVTLAELGDGIRGYNEPRLGQALIARASAVAKAAADERKRLGTARLVTGLGIAGSAIGLAGVITFRLLGDAAVDDFTERCSINACDAEARQQAVERSHVRTYDRWQVVSWVALGVGAATTVTGIVLWSLEATDEAERSPEPRAAIGIVGTTLRLRVRL